MRALLLVLLATASVSAHIVPVPPSSCAFDPITVEMPVAGTASPASTSDTLHIFYDPQSSTAQFDLTGVPPRNVSAGGVDGTLALSTIFVATLRNDGDLTAMPSLTFTAGAGSGTVAIPVTTGLVVAGATVLEGEPLGADGRFGFVGVVDPSPLPPPLAGGPLVVRLACQAVPRPDTDQFRLATRTTAVSASLTAKLLKGRVIFAPGTLDTPDFPGHPAIMRVSSGDTTIATVVLPSGLAAQGRKLFVGRSTDGRGAIGVRTLRRSVSLDYLMALKLKDPVLPPPAEGTVQVAITYDVGGLLSRVVLPMRAKRNGALLRYP